MTDVKRMSEMRMPDPKPTYAYLVAQIAERFPNFAYVHVVEPGVQGNLDYKATREEVSICPPLLHRTFTVGADK